MNLGYPFHLDGRGRTAVSGSRDHIRDLIEQFLFTNAGERVNRPDFGSGLMNLVFAGNSPSLAATVKSLIQGGLQLELGDLILVQDIDVTAEESTLLVTVKYKILATEEDHRDSFRRTG